MTFYDFSSHCGEIIPRFPLSGWFSPDQPSIHILFRRSIPETHHLWVLLLPENPCLREQISLKFASAHWCDHPLHFQLRDERLDERKNVTILPPRSPDRLPDLSGSHNIGDVRGQGLSRGECWGDRWVRGGRARGLWGALGRGAPALVADENARRHPPPEGDRHQQRQLGPCWGRGMRRRAGRPRAPPPMFIGRGTLCGAAQRGLPAGPQESTVWEETAG